jgi:hypothetical protein
MWKVAARAMSVYISIGNSDDKLSQSTWAHFVSDVDGLINGYATMKHGKWFSAADAPWQNACWCIEVSGEAKALLRTALANTAGAFEQDSIAWAEAETEFLRGA